MRKAYILASTLALFTWGINKVHAFPSPSPPLPTAATINRRQSSFRDIHLDSRQIRNADYSSNNSSPPSLNTKSEQETTPNSQTHPPTTQGTSSAPQTAESKDGKIKAARSIRVERRHSDLGRNLPLFVDAHVAENMAPVLDGVWKSSMERKQRRRLAPGEPVDTLTATNHLDSRQSYITRAPSKIDGSWWKKRQEAIYNVNRSPSLFDDIARAPKVSRAEGKKRNGRGASLNDSVPDKDTTVPSLATKPSTVFLRMFREPGTPQHVASRSVQWSDRDANFMDVWNKLAQPNTAN